MTRGAGTAGAASWAGTGSSTGPTPGRISASGCGAWIRRGTYRVSVWPAGDDAIAKANTGLRGGDELIEGGTRDPLGRPGRLA